MLAGLVTGTELKRFARSRMSRAALIAIVFMPLLYGALYLWAFWNPFGNLDKLPIALVNDDRGAVVDGTALNAGDQVESQLVASGDLDWQQVDAERAREGVTHGDYYFAVTIPEDFSEAVSSPMSDDPHKAVMQVTFNDTNNYLGSVIGENAMREMQAAVGESISAEAVDKVLVGLQTAGEGLVEAADGAAQLHDGAGQLESGLAEAKDGSSQLADGAGELAAGLGEARAGAGELADGLGRLDGGADQLGDGAQQISGGIDQLVGMLEPIGTAQSEAATAVAEVADLLRGNPDPISGQAVAALDDLTGLLTTEGFDQSTLGQLLTLRDGARQLAHELGDPSSTFRAGLSTAGGGADELASGLIQLSDGSAQLSDGATELDAGLAQLVDGSMQLSDGSGELAVALADGAEQVPAWSEAERQQVSETIGGPVTVEEQRMTHAPTFGAGFAPFFLSLALFVGSLIIWMLLRPVSTRALAGRLSALRVVLATYVPALLVVLAQVIVMFLVVVYAIGLDPVHTAAMFGVLILIGATYLALIQAFNIVFGVSVGRVVTLAFLMLQMVSSGGVYPVETTGKLFQILHPVDPMTYTVTALRQVTLGGMDGRLWTALAVLVGIWLASLGASALAVRRDRRWTIETLHPPVAV